MDERYCIWCKEIKPISQFTKTTKTYAKKQYYRSYCKPCYSKYSSQRNKKDRVKNNQNAKRRRNIKKEFWIKKFGNKCNDCQQTFSSCVYDFHHLDPTVKEFDPGRVLYSNKPLADIELEKCILLCANCHRLRHQSGTIGNEAESPPKD